MKFLYAISYQCLSSPLVVHKKSTQHLYERLLILVISKARNVRASATQQDGTCLEGILRPEYHAFTYHPCVRKVIYQYPQESNKVIQWSFMTLNDRNEIRKLCLPIWPWNDTEHQGKTLMALLFEWLKLFLYYSFLSTSLKNTSLTWEFQEWTTAFMKGTPDLIKVLLIVTIRLSR